MSLKEEIVQESRKLFSLKGFLSTSVNDIIEAAHTSKGGFYNHFGSKDELFLQVLAEAQTIWRRKVLHGIRQIQSPAERIRQILLNYRDRYLKDSENFPGGCIFITFSVELDDQRPHLIQEVNKGYIGFKALLRRVLQEGIEKGEFPKNLDTHVVAEMLFIGMLGASVSFGVEKSAATLDKSIDALIDYLEILKAK